MKSDEILINVHNLSYKPTNLGLYVWDEITTHWRQLSL